MRSNYASFTRKGTRCTGTFTIGRFRVRFTGLPDDPVTTLAVECESEPIQDNIMVRKERPRGQV